MSREIEKGFVHFVQTLCSFCTSKLNNYGNYSSAKQKLYICMPQIYEKMNKAKLQAFLEKIKFKYKVSILNENTLEETFHIRLSRLNVFLATCSLIALCFIINSILIIKTPLKQFLPGYESSMVRAEFIHNAIKVDSLENAVKKQNHYMEVMQKVLAGDIKIEKVVPLDSLALKKREEVLTTKSDREKEFCEEFEQEEQYNLGILTTPKQEKAFVFFRPAKGIILNKFNPRKGHYGVDIATAQNENVMAVLNGTVIYSGFTIDDGYVIAIQHENEYISIYKNNTQLLKEPGAIVKAGESIAITGGQNKSTQKAHLHFELWQKGKTLNPEEHIIF